MCVHASLQQLFVCELICLWNNLKFQSEHKSALKQEGGVCHEVQAAVRWPRAALSVKMA